MSNFRILMRVVALSSAALCFLHGTASAQERSAKGSEGLQKPFVRERIASIMKVTLGQGEFRTSEGIRAVIKVPPSTEQIQEVKNLGSSAIPVLSEYVTSKDPREQELAMRFLSAFAGDQIVGSLRIFAKHSAFAMNRAQALEWLAQTPLSKALPIIEDVSKTDSDPYVRKTATEILAKLSKVSPV